MTIIHIHHPSYPSHSRDMRTEANHYSTLIDASLLLGRTSRPLGCRFMGSLRTSGGLGETHQQLFFKLFFFTTKKGGSVSELSRQGHEALPGGSFNTIGKPTRPVKLRCLQSDPHFRPRPLSRFEDPREFGEECTRRRKADKSWKWAKTSRSWRRVGTGSYIYIYVYIVCMLPPASAGRSQTKQSGRVCKQSRSSSAFCKATSSERQALRSANC